MAATAVTGVVRHTVMLKLGNKADKEKVITQLRELEAGLPGVNMLKLEAVSDIDVSEGNSDVAVIAEFPDAENYLKYASHPKHLGIIAAIKPFLSGKTAIQYTPTKI